MNSGMAAPRQDKGVGAATAAALPRGTPAAPSHPAPRWRIPHKCVGIKALYHSSCPELIDNPLHPAERAVAQR